MLPPLAKLLESPDAGAPNSLHVIVLGSMRGKDAIVKVQFFLCPQASIGGVIRVGLVKLVKARLSDEDICYLTASVTSAARSSCLRESRP